MAISESLEVFAPIFVVGVQRSGTTLLRTILHAHPDLCIGYECAFYRILADKYGRGITEYESETFLDDILAVRRFDLWKLDREELRAAVFGSDARARDRPVPYKLALQRIASCYLKKEKPQAKHFGFKNPNGIYHLDFIFDLYPEARILHMVRDPRGVLSSEKKKRTKMGVYQSKDMIWAVARRHRRMMKIRDAYKSDPRYLVIQYRDLVTEFELTLEKVLNFLDLEVEDSVRDYHLIARDSGFTPQRELWQHGKSVERPDPTRVNMFKQELTLREISTIELLCGASLTELSTGGRYGSLREGSIGICQVLLHKIGQQIRVHKHAGKKDESLDSGLS